MQIKNKLFPYPTLNKDEQFSSYLSKSFEMKCDFERKSKKCVISNISFKTNSQYIQDLYDKKIIDFIIIVECSATNYRKVYRLSTLKGNTIVIYTDDIDDKCYVSMFGIANVDFELSSNEFQDDYQGCTLKVSPYTVIAIDNGFVFDAPHNDLEDNLHSSIFFITKDEKLKDNEPFYSVYTESNSRKIGIYLSPKQYDTYCIFKNDERFREVVFCNLLIPSLVEGIDTIKKEHGEGDLDTIIYNYRWFKAIIESYKKQIGEELTMDKFNDPGFSSIQLAQIVLGSPFLNSLEKLNQLANESASLDDEEDNL